MSALDRIYNMTVTQAFAIGLVLAGLYYFVGYNSGTNLEAQIEANKLSIQDTETKLAEENKKIQRLDEYKRISASMGENLQSLLTFIPTHLETFDLKKTISLEAKAAAVSLSRMNEITVPPPTAKLFYKELAVQVDLKGSFQQLMLFLSFLTRAEQFLTVHNLGLTVESSQNKSDSPMLRFTAEIHGYQYIEPEKPK